MGIPRIDRIRVTPRIGTMADIFTFRCTVSAEIVELKLLAEGQKAQVFNINNSVLRQDKENIRQWIVQRQFWTPGTKKLIWLGRDKKGKESALKEVVVRVKYVPLIYNLDLISKSGQSSEQEIEFYLTLDKWAEAIRYREGNAQWEEISLIDNNITVLSDEIDNHKKSVLFRKVITKAAGKLISFQALAGNRAGSLSCVRLYTPQRFSAGDRLERLLMVARAEIGYKEREINFTKYGAWFGLNGQPWCAMFVSWVFAKSGNGSLFPRTPTVIGAMNWFKNRGQWGNVPKVGAVVFFDFKDGFYHAGIVESVNNNGTITTIEGNVNDQVMRRTHYINNAYNQRKIIGYGYPQY